MTQIADPNHPAIQDLIHKRGWKTLSYNERIGAAYTFVKDEISFGYNDRDDLPASQVLAEGYGQCNTKGNLLFALLMALGIDAQFHGFTIHKELQRGAIPWWLQWLAPKRILHSWVEVRLEDSTDKWIQLEGFILDSAYLRAIQNRFPMAKEFSGFAIATQSLQTPEVDWNMRSTYIQRDGIADDFGTFANPDVFYKRHGTNLRGLRRFLFQNVLRHFMNRNLKRIRGGTVLLSS